MELEGFPKNSNMVGKNKTCWKKKINERMETKGNRDNDTIFINVKL